MSTSDGFGTMNGRNGKPQSLAPIAKDGVYPGKDNPDNIYAKIKPVKRNGKVLYNKRTLELMIWLKECRTKDLIPFHNNVKNAIKELNDHGYWIRVQGGRYSLILPDDWRSIKLT